MSIFAVLTGRQSFEDQFKRLKSIIEGVIAPEDRIVGQRMINELQAVNAECGRRGCANAERFKAVEGAFAFCMWIYRHGTEPTPRQCRAAGVPEWYPLDAKVSRGSEQSGEQGIAVAGTLEDVQSLLERGDHATALQLLSRLASQGDPRAQVLFGGMYADGLKGVVARDDSAAATWLRKAADQGDCVAQFLLGNMYYAGRGVPQNYAEAAKWYRKAADQRNASAQYNLGFMCYDGRGVQQNYADAAMWFRKSADKGNAQAEYNLAVMYDQGRGVPQSYAEAVKWYRKAADQGDSNAQINLGVMYDEGRGVPQDYIQAHKWWNLAASRSPASDAKNRDDAVKARNSVALKMTPTQIAEAQKLAREWKPK